MVDSIFAAALQRPLHTHHIQNDLFGRIRPDLVPRVRGGSNCGKVTIQRLLDFYLRQQNCQAIGVTDHSRDGQTQKSIATVTRLFYEQFMDHPEWVEEIFGYKVPLYTKEECDLIWQESNAAAKALIDYDDSRILGNWDRIELMRRYYPDKLILTGIELNKRPRGGLDTTMAYHPRCQLRILSVHPEVDEEGFAGIRHDPRLMSIEEIEGMTEQDVHILAHPGFGCSLPEDIDRQDLTAEEKENHFRDRMLWGIMTGVAIDRNVAIEINWSFVWKTLCRSLLDPDKFPVGQDDWKIALLEAAEMTPIVNSDTILHKLRPRLEKGLLLAINNDGHDLPPANAVPGRLDQALHYFGAWVDQRLSLMGARADHIINTWSNDRLVEWLALDRAAEFA